MRVIVGALLIFIISSSSSLGDPIRNRCDSGEDLYQLRAQKNAQNDADVKHHALHKQKDKHSNVNVNKNTNVVDDSDGVDDELEERIAIPAPQIRRKRPSLNAEIQPAIRFHQHQPRHHHRNHDDISEEQRKVHKDKNVNQNINVNLMENEEEGEEEDDEAKLTRRTLTPSNFSSTSDKNSETPRIPKHQNLNVLQKLITETVKESAKIDADSVNENSNKNQNEQTTQAPRHDHELRKKRLRKIGRLFKNRLTAGKKVIDIELESVDNAVTKQRPRDISKNANQNSNVNSNTNAQEQPELVSPSRRSSGNRNVNKNSNINTIEMRSLHVPESHRNENKNVNSNTNVMQDEDEDDFGDHENDDRPLRRSQPGRSHKTSKNENVNKNVNTNVDDIDDDNDDLDDGIGKRRSLGQRSSNKNSNSNSNVNSAVDNLENEDDDGNVDEEDDLSREERQRAQRHRGRPARRNYGSNRNVNKNSNVNTVEARLLNIPHRNQNKNVNVNSNSNSNVDSLQADEQPDLVNDKELDDEENAEPLEEEEEQQLYKPRRRSRNQNSNSNSNTNTNDLAGDLSDIYVAKRRSLTGSIGQRVDDDNNKNENVNSNVNSNSVQQLAKGEENQGNKHAPRQQKRVRKVRKPLRHQNANSSSTKSDNSAHPEAKVSAPVVNNDISLKKVQSDVVKRDRVVGAQPETLKQHIHQQPKPADNSLVLNKNKNTNVNSADPSADDVHAE